MPVTLAQFIKCLADSGVIPPEELSQFQRGLPPQKRPRSAEDLAKQLVLAGRLTRYQASLLYQAKSRGLVLGQYIVLDKIGAGGMGQVFKAQHKHMKRVVALKVLPAAATESRQAVKRFQREVQAAARLVHPNIVTAYDADEADGIRFLVMEYVDGHDLGTICRKRGSLPVHLVLHCIVQAARGLDYAHSQGVVHRDVKPGNLLINESGVVKILDLGLARLEETATETNDKLTQRGSVIGTPDYMAPEQAEDAHAADRRADIYSLGCTMHRLLMGAPPYVGTTLMLKLMAHREHPIPSLCAGRSDVPPQLDAVFRRMLAKRPEDRYPSMVEVIAEIEKCMQLIGPSAGEAGGAAGGSTRLTDFVAGVARVPSGPNVPSSSASSPSARPDKDARTSSGLPSILREGSRARSSGQELGASQLLPDPVGEASQAANPSIATPRVRESSVSTGPESWESLVTSVSIAKRRRRMMASVVSALALGLLALLLFFLVSGTGERRLGFEDSSRAAAEWVLERGGRLRVRAGDKLEWIVPARVADLPPGEMEIEEVDFSAAQGINDAAMTRVRTLKHLKVLDVSGASITDAGLQDIALLPSLERLRVRRCEALTGDALDHLQRRLPKLQIDRD